MDYNHDSISGIYDRLTDMLSIYQTVKTKAYLLNKLESNSNVLEIGCGNGGFALSCSEKCSTVVGLDVSENMIRNAKRLARRRRIKNVKFYRQDCLSFTTDQKFDHIVLAYFLNLFTDERTVKDVLKNLKSHLKAGGTILIADELQPINGTLSIFVNALRLPIFNFFYLTTGLQYHKIHDLEKLLESSGIQVLEEKRFLFQYCSVIIGKV